MSGYESQQKQTSDRTHGKVTVALAIVALQAAMMERKVSFMLTKIHSRENLIWKAFDRVACSLDVSEMICTGVK